MSIKVCFVPAGYKPIPPTLGGAVETLVQNFININEIEKRLEITVLSVTEALAKTMSQNYCCTKYIFFDGNERIDNLYYWCVYRVLKKVVNIILPDYILKLRMIRYLCQHQSEFDWIIFEAGEIDCLKYYSRFIDKKKIIFHSHGEIKNEKKLESCLNYYIAVSDYIKEIWTSTIKTSKEHSLTLKNGVNQEKFNLRINEKQQEEGRRKFAFSQEDIVLIFVGRIIPEKGVKELLAAMKELPEQFKLIMIGSSSFGSKTSTAYEQKVELLINELGERVKFTGYIPNDQVGIYYQLGDISVVPSMFDDPAPLVIIESMAAGLPIVTSGSGGIREYCDEKCAVFVDRGHDFEKRLSQSIQALADKKEKRAAMSDYARERAKKFTDKAQYKELVRLLEMLGR